jgi:MFS family permease
VSVLLVVPQFTLSTFGLVWLIADLGWSAVAAGVVVAIAQFVGAGGRIVVGSLSDRFGRMRLLRLVAVAGVVALLLVAATGAAGWALPAAILLVVATTISVADNGLAFTSVAEAAGPGWSGRALGIQNTGQFIAASAVAPGVGALVVLVGFPLAFALVAVAPLAALPLVPKADVHA